ncbi:cleft lip and palate transmembrane protein 1 homolog [Cucurbita maxima]|uniref:Cleft lip and palate transmembrane protein 1 homolog n=1 Tax=Cucurbita maxima TaxID=3661 RepID=A0A6J1HRD1_CUCMA|nr:cleft lip and palate transmembrane protein 1 homolog [Cucurbita maxima]
MATPAVVGGPGGGGGAAVAPRAGGQQQQQQQGGFAQSLTGIIRIAVFWYFASKFFAPKKPSDSAILMSNLFQKGEPLDMWVYLSEHERFNDFGDEGALVWHENGIPYAVWGQESSRSLSFKYYPSEALEQNGTLYAHVFFARSGYTPDPNDPEFQPLATFGRAHPIVMYFPKSKAGKRRSLLGSSEGSDTGETLKEVIDDDQVVLKDDGPVEWVSYWKPNVTVNLVDDFTQYAHNGVPPNIAPYLNVEPTTGNYYPTIFFNDFWLLRDKLVQINRTVDELVLNLEVAPISMIKWQLFLQIDQSFQIHHSYGSMLEGEADELKRVFLEGNLYLLAVTMVVSLLHSVFYMLAFKNDIQFWNKNKSMEGLSAKSVIFSFISQLIIFLYLLDNDTSWMILASSGIGCCIEFWKIGKAMHIEIDGSGRISMLRFDPKSYAGNKNFPSFDFEVMLRIKKPIFRSHRNDTMYHGFLSTLVKDFDRSGRIPMLRFRDRESYSGNKTKKYDDLAMKYLSYVLFFLAACSSVYLSYEQYKSWYSWILSSLTSFIMMCPQLFINYKLKSVAHLPWRQITYKFLNTIIDDLFAFVIKMPTLHRLSVFQDDIIFLIYLYQRWKYPVDKKRINEFGFGGEENGGDEATNANAIKDDDKKTN